MKHLIIISHPWDKSFNYAVLNEIKRKMKSDKVDYEVIDLHKDGFNPVMSQDELAVYSEGLPLDPLVNKYQTMLKGANKVTFIFPIWWYSTPAILKGFIDKVMLKGFAFDVSSSGLNGKLSNIKQANVITTSDAPTWYIKIFKGNFIRTTFRNAILKDIGITKLNWINFANISKNTKVQRRKFLEGLDVHHK